MNKKNLSELLIDIIEIDLPFDRAITGLSLDSRHVKKGDLFFAMKGFRDDGHKYIDEAISKGAVVIIAEGERKIVCDLNHSEANDIDQVCFYDEGQVEEKSEIPFVKLGDLKKQMGVIAASFYDNPSKNITVIGVTGTNGKTSCVHFMAQALQMSGKKVGILGTVGNGLLGQCEKSQLTTPDPLTIQKIFSTFRDQEVTHVVMEASSHGLDQGRLKGIQFDLAIFTNLSRDHLDYHGDMLAYGAAKRKLFLCPDIKSAIFNIDDEYGRQLLNEFHPKLKSFGYSAEARVSEQDTPLIRAHQVHLSLEGLTASVHTPWGDGLLHTKLLGRFNLSNLLAVLSAMGILGFPLEETLSLLSEVTPVTGRMERFGGGGKPHVVVDFAHTPDALRQSLLALREYTEGEVWVVFGCGGNRDQGKRALMGQIAENNADHIIVTDDNPRFEAPLEIVADILQGMTKPEAAVVEHDRRRAIDHAIICAAPNDIVLIAGKGHESTQQYGDEKRIFNDGVEVQMILAASSEFSKKDLKRDPK